MLFCVTSILDRATAAVLDALSRKGSEIKEYKEGIIEEIMENEGWKKDLAISLLDPYTWLEFRKRPFSVLVVVYPIMKEGEVISSERYNYFTSRLLLLNEYSLNRVNMIEIKEDEIERLTTFKIRPSWEAYFMSIAQIASTRSNCMKRQVGAVIVKNNRVLCIGYNGTPTGEINCSDGGCSRCNENTRRGKELSNCFCIHAEESAFLERSSSEINGSYLYTTVYPCRLCSRKIVQLKISKVYYIYEYTEDSLVKDLFIKNRIEVHRLKE